MEWRSWDVTSVIFFQTSPVGRGQALLASPNKTTGPTCYSLPGSNHGYTVLAYFDFMPDIPFYIDQGRYLQMCSVMFIYATNVFIGAAAKIAP